MKYQLIIITTFLFLGNIKAQNSFKAIIKNAQTKEPLIGASAVLKNSTKGNTANTEGVVKLSKHHKF